MGARCGARLGSGRDGLGLRSRLRADLSGPGAVAHLAARWHARGPVDRRDGERAMTPLDDPRTLQRLDPHNARKVLAEFPAQCRSAGTLVSEPPLRAARPRVVVVAGMGGSAASGDLLAAYAAETVDVPILVHRGYGLPALAGPHAVVIASSYSGETAEVLSAFDVAVARKVPVVAVTAGGALAQRAASTGTPRVTLPAGLMPRMALGYLFFPS